MSSSTPYTDLLRFSYVSYRLRFLTYRFATSLLININWLDVWIVMPVLRWTDSDVRAWGKVGVHGKSLKGHVRNMCPVAQMLK